MKPIKDYEELYSIDEKGNILSIRTGKYLVHDLCHKNKAGIPYPRVQLSKEGKSKKFPVHRLLATAFIPNPLSLPFVDHIDRNPAHLCLYNLRWCTHSQNQQNKDKVISSTATSKYKGVSWDKRYKHWVVYLNVEKGRVKNFGYFKEEDDAGRHYNNLAKEFFGKFAVLNEI